MPEITIIIPIYNCEKYIEQCIRSVFSQTLKDLEIICVDDGSTDQSIEVIKQLRAEDARVILLQQKNQGAGAARNKALKEANGKYVAFLDADDYYLDPKALELMVENCEKERLYACAGLRKCVRDETLELDALFQKVVKGAILNYRDYQLDYNFQDFIFLREILTENGFYFPQHRRFEDPPFLARVLYEADRFMVVDIYLYCYRLNDTELRFNSRNTCDLLCGIIDNLTFAREHNLEVLFSNTVSRLEYEFMSIILKNIVSDDLGIIKLLIQANQIVCDQMGNPDHIIRPLRAVLLHAGRYEKKLLEKLKEQDEILLYGAGKYGQVFLQYLKKNNLLQKVSYIIVSDLNGNASEVENIPVIVLDDLRQTNEKTIFVTVWEMLQQEIKECLDRKGYWSYEIIKDEFLYMISEGIIG